MESTTNHRISLRGSLGPVIFPHGNFGSKVPGSSLSPPTKLLWSIIQMFDCKIQIRSQECKNLFKDRKSTRLNSSHVKISYAVFCLKKKTTIVTMHTPGS